MRAKPGSTLLSKKLHETSNERSAPPGTGASIWIRVLPVHFKKVEKDIVHLAVWLELAIFPASKALPVPKLVDNMLAEKLSRQ
jgi:hypothetical protein